MATIRLLPSDVVNKIAAGEVVERPASVVKELVENALDAGASRIEVELVDGGRGSIRVADDGRGMSREDARLSVERHATSKLRDAEGLFRIASFGFRGEALAAIASVSRLTLVSREPDALEGTRIEIDGGSEPRVETCGAPRGTSILVRDLFYAVPARRKFLKRAETEAGHAQEALIRLALGRPDVAFSLTNNGRTLFRSAASPDLRERIAEAIGREAHAHLLEVKHSHGVVSVRGHAASPNWSAATTRAIYTFVNGRCVRDRQLFHAVQKAYEELLPSGRSPGVVLFVEVPPTQLDVNVHPQKLEVRFADPRSVYEAIYRALGQALSTGDWLPAAEAEGPSRSFAVPASAQPLTDWHARARAAARMRDPHLAAEALWPRPGDRDGAPAGSFASLRFAGELTSGHLLCESPSGSLLVLDAHAAHERVLLHQLKGALAEEALQARPFLFPATVELGVAEARVLAGRREALAPLGIELEPFGGTTFALKAVPAPLVGVDYRRLLTEIAARLSADADEEAMLASLACLACDRPARRHSEEEARALLDALDDAAPAGALHAEPIVAEIPLSELSRRRD